MGSLPEGRKLLQNVTGVLENLLYLRRADDFLEPKGAPLIFPLAYHAGTCFCLHDMKQWKICWDIKECQRHQPQG
jgi:hypothetical protein